MYTIEKFLLHLNQGAPPHKGFVPPHKGLNPLCGGISFFIMNGAGAQYNRHQNIWQKTKEGGGGGAQIPYVVA